MGEAVPARSEAKEMEEEVRQLERSDLEEYRCTGRWSDEEQEAWYERRDLVSREWDVAERLSFAAGFDFTDRHGKRHLLTKESIVARNVEATKESPRRSVVAECRP